MIADDAAIGAEDLVAGYGRAPVLRDFCCAVPWGGVTALVGPNGAGKSTFLDACLGLIGRAKGAVRVAGRDPAHAGGAIRAQVGYVESDHVMDPSARVHDILGFWRRLRPSWNDGAAREMVARFDLPLAARTAQLSRGARMKLALVGALSFQPEILILDEPFDGLDAGVREEVSAALTRHLDGRRRTVLLTSHDFGEIERLADCLIVIANGHAVSEGSPDEVRGRCVRLRVRFGGDVPPAEIREASGARCLGSEAVLTTIGAFDPAELRRRGATDFESLPAPDLRDAVAALCDAAGGRRKQ
jgi:ABC-2 type transport system ATP-binding protein